MAQALIDTNPAKGVKVGERRNAKAARLPFDSKALQAIFSSPVFTEGARPGAAAGEAAYWLPLLALYTGARLEELGQLAPSDVQEAAYEDTGGTARTAWVLRISDEGHGQALKNAGSRRRVPVHPELLRLGFVEYALAQKGARLFPDLRPDADGVETALWGKWFSKYLRGVCAVTDARMVFHSFRHTFKDAARECEIPEDVADAITGHSSGSVARRYGGLNYPLRPLVEAMNRFRVPGVVLPFPAHKTD